MNDVISRQAAIAVADSSDYVGLSVDDVKKVTDEVVKGLKQLPSAEPERKKGEWENTRPDAPMFGFYYCSLCGRKRTSPQDRYCPNCGAKMVNDNE